MSVDRVKNAFRKAKNSNHVLEQASEALGYPIEVLSGAEEARLIYLGVAHDRPRTDGGRLVIDIGGYVSGGYGNRKRFAAYSS